MNIRLNQPSYFLISLLLMLLCSACSIAQEEAGSKIIKSEIRQTEGGYRIFLNEEPFFVQGAGVHKGNLESLARHGANSFRTWSMENGREVLDQAQQLGLKVMMGIWVGLERHGFNYNDEEAVQEQLERIRGDVEQLKDHPALMLWGIGNEMNLLSTNPKVWDAVNEISEMIHEVDPNHLTTTSLSGIDKKDVDLIAARASDLDFISIQMYRAIEILPELVTKSGYEGPLLVTEWGATGYWEVGKTLWGAPLENNSSEKADFYLSRYQNSIESHPQVMGSFVFLWGQKQERTPTWFGMFMSDGQETESVDVMHYVWNEEWPGNRSPRLRDFTLNGRKATDNIRLESGKEYLTEVIVDDPDQDELLYRWEIMPESKANSTGGDAEYIPASIEGLFPADATNATAFRAPATAGAYRLFIYVEDGQDHTAHANIPFWVE